MADRVRIIGSYLSPYVRKVLVCLHIKGIAYEIDPIIPFMGDDRFSTLSPLRRVPVLIDDCVTLSDSSVICQYLEDRYPRPAFYPADIADRARARWLEEFADTRMGDVFIWRYYYQLVVRRFVWQEGPDEEIVRKAREREIPEILDYLESELPAEGFLFGSVSTADISIASPFRNAAFARFSIDASLWPITASFVARTLALPPFEALKRYEDATIGAPVTERRTRLLAVGAPLTETTLGTPIPQRGVMLA